MPINAGTWGLMPSFGLCRHPHACLQHLHTHTDMHTHSDTNILFFLIYSYVATNISVLDNIVQETAFDLVSNTSSLQFCQHVKRVFNSVKPHFPYVGIPLWLREDSLSSWCVECRHAASEHSLQPEKAVSFLNTPKNHPFLIKLCIWFLYPSLP